MGFLVPMGYIKPALILLLPLLGLFIDFFLLSRLYRLTKRTRHEWDETLIGSLKYIPTFISLAIAIHLSFETYEFLHKYTGLKDRFLSFASVLIVSLFLSRLLGGLLELYMKSYKQDIPATSLIVQIAKVIVLLIGLVVALDKIGVAITPLITALGVGGLAVALALRDTLENLFAGFHILASKQLKPGDFVRLENGLEGIVEDITWRNTLIRQLSNNLIVVPNSKITSSIILNLHMPQPEMNVLVNVGVSYDSDLEKVERITLEVAKEVQREVEGAVPDFEPTLRFREFGDFSINLVVALRAKDAQSQYLLVHEFIKRLHRRYHQEGIKIPFPVREVYLRSS